MNQMDIGVVDVDAKDIGVPEGSASTCTKRLEFVSNSNAHRLFNLTVSEIYTFEPGRPPKNIEVLQFIISRTAGNNWTRWRAIKLAAEEIRDCWRSFGLGIENDFAAPVATLQSRIYSVYKQYRNLIKRAETLTDQSSAEFLEEIFCPLKGWGNTFPKNKIAGKKYGGKRKAALKGDEFDVEIYAAVVTIPSFDDFFDGSPSSSAWFSSSPTPEMTTFDYEATNGFEDDVDNPITATVEIKAKRPNHEDKNLSDKAIQANLCPCPPLTRLSSLTSPGDDAVLGAGGDDYFFHS